jgi:serine/threonine-protein kinase RsbT
MCQVSIIIQNVTDITLARSKGRNMAAEIGFTKVQQVMLSTVISELARNIFTYAKSGVIIIEIIEQNMKKGILVIARDKGPGIPDIELALQDGFSTSGGLGMGLPGVKRLMHEFEITSELGKGTTVTTKMWVNNHD